MDTNAGRKRIAEKAGVSKTTVTRVLSGNASVSEKTKEKVLRVIDELGYTHNKLAINLSRNRNNNFIAMLVPDMTNYYYLQMFDTIMRLLDGTDYTISVYHVTEQNMPQMLDHILAYRVGAVINMSLSPLPSAYLKKLRCANIKVIHPNKEEDPVQLTLDYAAAMRQAFDGMWQAGRRDFRFICGADDRYIVDRRIATFLRLLDAYGIADGKDTLVWGEYPLVSALQAGYDGMKKLADERVDAVFCLNDMMALGAIKALREAGKEAGRDVSVVGFDNILLGEYSQPRLSTVDSFVEEEARRYVDYIFERETQNCSIVSQYVERDSARTELRCRWR